MRRGVVRPRSSASRLFALVALLTYAYDQKFMLVVLAVVLALFGLLARYAVPQPPDDGAHGAQAHAPGAAADTAC